MFSEKENEMLTKVGPVRQWAICCVVTGIPLL